MEKKQLPFYFCAFIFTIRICVLHSPIIDRNRIIPMNLQKTCVNKLIWKNLLWISKKTGKRKKNTGQHQKKILIHVWHASSWPFVTNIKLRHIFCYGYFSPFLHLFRIPVAFSLCAQERIFSAVPIVIYSLSSLSTFWTIAQINAYKILSTKRNAHIHLIGHAANHEIIIQ